MECVECGDSGANPTEVRFVAGASHDLALCVPCLETYERGSFVRQVTVK